MKFLEVSDSSREPVTGQVTHLCDGHRATADVPEKPQERKDMSFALNPPNFLVGGHVLRWEVHLY